MKNLYRFAVATLFLGLAFSQTTYAQCYELGTPVGQLSSIIKGTPGVCPTPAQSTGDCDCPPGFVVIGYEGFEGNGYGPMVISQFSLRCRELNSDGTLGASVSVTCANGNVAGNTPEGPVDAPAGEAIVGFEIRIGCAIDAVMGESKSVVDIAAGLPNTTSNSMAAIGGTGGAPQPVMYVPNGNVIVGMETFIDPGNNLSAGVAWRYAPINNVPCPAACSVDAITVGNISACNDQGTPDPSDDTFTGDVTVDFSNAPASGNLSIGGDGAASVVVGSLNSATSHTFTNVSMSADGTPISITANFTANTGCSLTNTNAGMAPAACSSTTPTNCDITGLSVSNISACDDGGTDDNTSDDTFTADVTVTFTTPPNSGTLNLSGDGLASIPVGSLGAGTYTFNAVSMQANGTPINLTASFSAAPACNLTNSNAGTAPASCSPNAPTIPTMSEWGLILFALIIFTLSVVFGTQQQRAMAMSGTKGQVSSGWKLPFDKVQFLRALPMVYLGFAMIFGIAIALFGYELTNADIPGSLLSGLVIAYLVQFVSNSKTNNH